MQLRDKHLLSSAPSFGRIILPTLIVLSTLPSVGQAESDLMGIAAMESAMSPAVVQGINSAAQVAESEIAGKTNVDIANINAGTAKDLAATQERENFVNTKAAEHISENNTWTAFMMGMARLREIAQARIDSNNLKRQEMERRARREDQELALNLYKTQKLLENDRVNAIAKLSLEGLAPGNVTVPDGSSSQLTINRSVGLVNRAPVMNSFSAPSQVLAGPMIAQRGIAIQQTQAPVLSAQGNTRLLSSVQDTSVIRGISGAFHGVRDVALGATAPPRDLTALLNSSPAAGSSRDKHLGSDLTSFTRQVASTVPSTSVGIPHRAIASEVSVPQSTHVH